EVIKPLLPGFLLRNSSHVPQMDMLDVYDAHFKKVSSIHTLTEGITPKSFDKCTLIVEVSSGAGSLTSFLNHYHTLAQFESILIIWASTEKPPLLKAPKRNAKRRKKKIQYDYRIPIDIVTPSPYTPNSIFTPYDQITTDCIVLADTHWLIPHDQLNFAVSLFQGHFFNNLIGFSRNGHSVARLSSGQWEYVPRNDGSISLLESAGLVFHRKYLKLYSSSLVAAGRKLVAKEMECGGTLLNVLVANSTSSGPVVITTYGNSTSELSSEKVLTRSRCVNAFISDVFEGKMPLKASTSKFQAPKPVLKRSMKVIEYPDEATPSFKQHKFVEIK
ncbi:Exostoses (Multiple)-like 3, partial [Rhizoclosmatium hyalinum]